MASIQLPDVGNLTKLEDLIRQCGIAFSRVSVAFNGGLDLADNVRGKVANITFLTANQETKIDHNLGYKPKGYFLIGSTAALSIYDGLNGSTEKSTYLKSSAVGSARILFF